MTSSHRLPVRPGPLLLFGLLAAGIVATEYAVVHRADFSQHPALPPAVAFDLLVVLPAVFYLCLVRQYRLPLTTLVAALSGGLALSYWLLPAGGVPLLEWAGRLVGVGEVAVAGYTAVRLRRVVRGYQLARTKSADFIENLFAAGQPVLGRLTEAVMTEVAVARYALLGAWVPLEAGSGEQPFSTHRTSGFGALLAAFAGLSVVELAAGHLVIGHWFPRAAWVATALSVYSLLWLLAHGQAVRRRPVLLTATTLVVRAGFVWRVAVPRAQLLSVKKLTDVPTPAPGLLNAARLLLTPPNLLLTFSEPQPVRGLYGLHRTVRRLAIYVDEPAELLQQLADNHPTH
ncbi:hypothetical protein E4631_12965 [Hymenobacter sp. UV11]|uniref:hypothetical protein n=1 Tax=Hymenobacter sp. UV11 TaxID=1849735 RepID=UPI00105B8D95|nr:hypothetical protein [Hymenobacter sp. UV11]TFZ66003.1 hypothetical protein E4631_12965 [Hymenobacter sp. UV11]